MRVSTGKARWITVEPQAWEVNDVGFLVEATHHNERSPNVRFCLRSIPAYTNQSHQPRLVGSCGETNNVSLYALGLRRITKITGPSKKDVYRARLRLLTADERNVWLRAHGYEALVP
jgi:hypothetical protein